MLYSSYLFICYRDLKKNWSIYVILKTVNIKEGGGGRARSIRAPSLSQRIDDYLKQSLLMTSPTDRSTKGNEVAHLALNWVIYNIVVV